MRILMVGLGSIGQRHARNLRALYGQSVDLLAYRARGLSHVIDEGMTIDDGIAVEQAYGIRAFDRLDGALAEKPGAAIICNPSSLHVATATAAARAGCHLFIEKPLSHSETGIDELIETVDRQKLVATVGFQLRFHPALLRVRRLLCDGAIGAVRSTDAEFGEYLPDAHPYEDYRMSYAARADLGGGVILCYLHEVDYLCWLFGAPRRLHTTGGRLGDLDLDVEDTALTDFEFSVGGKPVPVRLRQSFLQQPAVRRCTIAGENGTIHLDLHQPSITIASRELTRREGFEGFRRNQLFEAELAHFFDAIAAGSAPAVPLRDAALTQRVALAMKASLGSGESIELPQ